MKFFDNAPWWLISAGFHAVLLLGATLVAMEQLVEIEVHAEPPHVRPPEFRLPDEPRAVEKFDRKRPLPVDIDAREHLLQQPFVFQAEPAVTE